MQTLIYPLRRQPAFGVQGRPAAHAGGGDRLLVDVVGDVAGGEDAFHAGRRAVRVLQDDEAHFVGCELAAEEGNYLTKFAKTVHLVHRRDSMSKASKIMADRLLSNPKVKPVWNSTVEEVLGEPATGVTGVRVRNLNTGDTSTIPANGMFVAIGHTPNTTFLNGQLQLDSKGFVALKDPFRTLTSVEGIFAAGDVADPTYKQAITAAGMGCKAALDAERWLAEKNIH